MSLAIALLIGVYLQFEFSFDQGEKTGNSYRLLTTFKYPNSPETTTAMSSLMMGPYLQREFPEIEDFLRVVRDQENILCRAGEKEFTIGKVLQVDTSFFHFFNHEVLLGNPETLFQHPGNIVLTNRVANTFFGDENPINKTIEHTYTLPNGMDTTNYYTVSGVLKNLPVNSHLQYEALIFLDDRLFESWSENQKWHGVMANTYFHISPGIVDVKQVVNKFAFALEKEMPNSEMIGLDLQPFHDIHTGSTDLAYDNNNYLSTNSQYLTILGLIALFILIIGAINFGNLSTVLALKRSQEIGVRKTLGATRTNVTRQFIWESLLMTFFAGLLAVAWAEICRKPFISLLGRNIDIQIFSWFNLSGFVIFLILIGLLAGIYPAVKAAKSSTSEVFQNARNSVSFKRPFIQSLVVLQFVLSGILIIGSIICYQQISFIKNKDLGFQYDQVVEMEIGGDNWMKSSAFKREIAQIPGVRLVSGSDNSIGTINTQNGVMVRNEETRQWENYPMSIIRADHLFFDLFGMQFQSGRAPTAKGADSELEYVVNETFVKKVGWTGDPLGQEIIRAGLPEDRTGRVVGVIKDIHHNTLRHSIEPICIQASDISSVISVKIDGSRISGILSSIQQVWADQIKNRPFDYRFMDEHFAEVYASESRLGKALLIATIVSIIIASLGLLALSAFVISQRTREIGIRKVLGASVISVVGLLSRDFLRLVLIAFVLAAPVAWLLLHKWLQDFAYHVDIHWGVFLLAAMLAVLTAFATISIQSIRTALSNPVESLRNN